MDFGGGVSFLGGGDGVGCVRLVAASGWLMRRVLMVFWVVVEEIDGDRESILCVCVCVGVCAV